MPDDLIYDDPLDQEMKERDKALLQQALTDFRATFNNPAGKRVLCDLITFCGEGTDGFTGNSRGMYIQGRQSVGLYLRRLAERAEPALAVEVYRMRLEGNNAQEESDGAAG